MLSMIPGLQAPTPSATQRFAKTPTAAQHASPVMNVPSQSLGARCWRRGHLLVGVGGDDLRAGLVRQLRFRRAPYAQLMTCAFADGEPCRLRQHARTETL